MNRGGAILDIQACMNPLTWMLNEHLPPNQRQSTPSVAGKISAAGEKLPRHILVVDDEPLIRWSVTESLSDLGCEVEQAADAASALRAVMTAATPYEVVVLDLRLPDMDDLSLLSTIRQVIPATTVILMTAFSTPEIVANAQALGAAVIHKPFELDELRRLVLSIGSKRQ